MTYRMVGFLDVSLVQGYYFVRENLLSGCFRYMASGETLKLFCLK
jgi:hypothetical protein